MEVCPKCKEVAAVKASTGRMLCKACGKTSVRPQLPGEHFPAPDGHSVRGVSTLHDADGNVVQQWVKTSTSEAERAAQLQALVEAAVAKLPRLAPRERVGKTLPHLLAGYPIGDAHVGMLSWKPETGESWDLEIAERVQCGAMAALVEAAPRAERAVIVDLGDWEHYDSLEPVTTRSGHVLDADSRFAKMIGVGLKVMRQCVESALRRHDVVDVIALPGNHNETGALWRSLALAALYERDERVRVDSSPSVFRYFRHGKTLVGCHHGHTCKPDKLPGVMAADRSKDWGETEHRYWWLGHVHHQQVKEHPGVIVESFNTLAAKDAYAAAGGWRAQRNMKCIVLHDEHGEVARHTVNARMVEAA
jgi:hypothetical protein